MAQSQAHPDGGGRETARSRPLPARSALRSQDLVSLPALRALLHERNVTRAGEAIGLSQPATSAILARLRRRFGDQLLVRVGREFELTPLATGLLARLDAAVDALDRLFGDEFDPATSAREFTLVASDYVFVVLGEALNQLMAEEAPGVSLDLRQLTSHTGLELDATLRQVDGVVMPHELVQGYPGEVLVRDRWVCLVAESNDMVGEGLTVQDLARLPWVTQYSRLTPSYMPALRQLRALGVEPQVGVVVEGFESVPFLVAGSNRVAFLQERLARRLAGVAPVRILPPPIDVGELTLSIRWHPSATDDPGHRWLRSALRRAAAPFR